MLRATTACNFSSLIWRAASAPAALASLLFDPPEPQNHWKNTVFRDFPTFSRICIFFLLTLSLLIFSLLIFLFSASALLCFSSVHIVGSLTSKLPSVILILLILLLLLSPSFLFCSLAGFHLECTSHSLGPPLYGRRACRRQLNTPRSKSHLGVRRAPIRSRARHSGLL